MKVHFSKNKNNWGTPEWLFKMLDEIFRFSIDLAADESNHLCRDYASEKHPDYSLENHAAGWLNPPYSPTKLCYGLVEKAYEQSRHWEVPVVVLIPARTDTKLWQEILFPDSDIVFFFKGRLKFVGAKQSAPFPSALTVIGETPDQGRLFTQAFSELGTAVYSTFG